MGFECPWFKRVDLRRVDTPPSPPAPCPPLLAFFTAGKKGAGLLPHFLAGQAGQGQAVQVEAQAEAPRGLRVPGARVCRRPRRPAPEGAGPPHHALDATTTSGGDGSSGENTHPSGFGGHANTAGGKVTRGRRRAVIPIAVGRGVERGGYRLAESLPCEQGWYLLGLREVHPVPGSVRHR